MFIYGIKDILSIYVLGIGILTTTGLYVYVCYKIWEGKRGK